MTEFKLHPSILSADFSQLERQIHEAETCGADGIHIDVMDGHFVPSITFGTPIIKAIRSLSRLPLDIHMMTTHPENHFSEFATAGADSITVHYEACPTLKDTLVELDKFDVRKCVALNPRTPIEKIFEIIHMVDQILIMSVEPGAGGQKFIPESLMKIQTLSKEIESQGLSIPIQVDGGINPDTALGAVRSGANILVAGSSVFNDKFSICDGISKLRNSSL
ncbi:MAG TPA: ribulose-phosphate 3-epimerase [Dehalococcoidia bacterium]|nr:ribulose-phosphate 3-epimerase [Dehalococcoidia bacterium]